MLQRRHGVLGQQPSLLAPEGCAIVSLASDQEIQALFCSARRRELSFSSLSPHPIPW